MITITLNQILAQNPCADGWARILHARGKITEQQMQEVVDGGCVPKSYDKLADDELFPLALALESNGLDDVLWSLRCLPDDHRLWRKYAVWCARQVQHLMRDRRSINALDVAWRHIDGLATNGELAVARNDAYAAAAAAAAEGSPGTHKKPSCCKSSKPAIGWIDHGILLRANRFGIAADRPA